MAKANFKTFKKFFKNKSQLFLIGGLVLLGVLVFMVTLYSQRENFDLRGSAYDKSDIPDYVVDKSKIVCWNSDCSAYLGENLTCNSNYDYTRPAYCPTEPGVLCYSATCEGYYFSQRWECPAGTTEEPSELCTKTCYSYTPPCYKVQIPRNDACPAGYEPKYSLEREQLCLLQNRSGEGPKVNGSYCSAGHGCVSGNCMKSGVDAEVGICAPAYYGPKGVYCYDALNCASRRCGSDRRCT